MESVPVPDRHKAAEWAMDAVKRPDLSQVVGRMSDRQVKIFEDLLANMEVDSELSYRFVPDSARAGLEAAIEAKNAEILAARTLVAGELRRREIGL
jgi:hypothetical protein